jgi:DNA helicase-2/ATP-dependent DNA helicase PcrA
MDIDVFGDIDKTKLRLAKPTAGTPPKSPLQNDGGAPSAIRRLKPMSGTSANTSGSDSTLAVGNIVMHERFGKGQIVSMEGIGADKKAEIRFDVGGLKKLLLRFAKLEVIG